MAQMAYFCSAKVNILKGFGDLLGITEPILNRLRLQRTFDRNQAIL